MVVDYSVKYRRLFFPSIKLSKPFAISFGEIIESDNERVFNLVDMYDAVCYEPDRDKAMRKADALCREIVDLKLKRPSPLKANEKKALNVLYYSLITYEWKEIQH